MVSEYTEYNYFGKFDYNFHFSSHNNEPLVPNFLPPSKESDVAHLPMTLVC